MATQGTETYFAPPEKEPEDALSRQAEKLLAEPIVARLLDTMPEPTVVLNSKRQIVLANEKTETLLGDFR